MSVGQILRQKRALLRHCNAWQSWKAFYGSVSIDANIASKPATWVFLGPPVCLDYAGVI